MKDALRTLYPQVIRTENDKAYDSNGSEVNYDKVAVKSLEESQTYFYKRQMEYPPITDYLDGIVKGDTQQVQDYIDACLAVKAKYPKPE